MIQYVYAVDLDGIMGYETEDSLGRPVFKQPVICRKDREFFAQAIAETFVVMGGNTLRAILQETNGRYPRRMFNEIAVFTRDENLIHAVRSQGAIVHWLKNDEDLKRCLQTQTSDISVIGGASLFDHLDFLGVEVQKHIVTEFDQHYGNLKEPVNWISVYEPPGSCKTGEVREGWFRRMDCKKFEDVDQQGNPVTGYFAEYEVL